MFPLLNFILLALNAVIFYKLLTFFVSPKNSRILRVVSTICSCFLVAMIIAPEDMLNVMGAFILFMLMMFFCFKDSIIQRIAVSFILFPLIIAVSFLTENVGLQTYTALGGVLAENIGVAAFEAGPYFLMDGFVHLFFSMIKTGFWYFVYRLLRHRLPNVKKFLTKGMWAVISIICLAPLSGIISLVCFTPKNNMLVYPAMLSSIATILGILLLTGYISGTVATEMENKNFRVQEAYYAELEKSQKDTAKIRHDMNNHLGVIAAFFESGDIQEAKSYYRSLSIDLQANNRVFCKNSIVNAVINAKYNKAVAQGIECFFNIDLGNTLPIDNTSLCSIFANTLDNAVEACQLIARNSKRSISLKARYMDSYFSYEIINTKQNDIIEKSGVIATNKPDKKNHGYGISNLRDIMELYNGVLGISYSENEFKLNMLVGDL